MRKNVLENIICSGATTTLREFKKLKNQAAKHVSWSSLFEVIEKAVNCIPRGTTHTAVESFRPSLSELDSVKPVAEKLFGGVPLESLNEIAQSGRAGGYVTIIGEKLYYHYKSGRGHQTFNAEFCIKNGKLNPMTFGSYPGQRSFPDRIFMDLVNSKFTFEEHG